MAEYKIVVQIDPSQAKRGGDEVEQKLRQIDQASARLKSNIDRALAFDGAGEGTKSLVDMAAAASNANGEAGRLASTSDKLGSTTKSLAASTRETTSALNEMGNAVKAAEAAERAAYKATQDLSRGATQAATAVKAQAVAHGDMNSHMALYAAHMAKGTTANDNMIRSGKQMNGMLTQMSFQMNDVVTSIGAGAAPMQVFAQQAGQIFQALQMGPGGVGGSLKALLGLVGPVVAVWGTLSAVVGLSALAFIKGNAESTKLANTLKITGDYAGFTADEFVRMNASVAAATDTGMGKARGVMLQLTATGKFTSDTINYLSQDIIEMSKFTGQSAADMATYFQGMGDNVGDFAAKFNSQYHLLTYAQIEHIRLLEQQGQTTQAQLELAIAIHEKLGEIGPANLGYLERAWHGVTGAINGAWEALKRFGSEEAKGAQQKAILASRIATAQRDAGANPNEIQAARIKGLQDEWIALVKIDNERAATVKTNAAEAKTTADATKAAAEYDRRWAGVGDSVARATKEIEAYRRGQDAIRKANPTDSRLDSAAQRAAKEAEITKRATPAASAAASKAATAAAAAARRAETLGREASAVEATTKANYELAASYDKGDVAALQAQARAEAIGKAITKQGDIDAYVARQLELNASKVAAATAKEVADLRFKSEALAKVNDSVAAGTANAAAANQAMEIEARLRPAIAAADAASAENKGVLLAKVDQLREALTRYNDEQQRTQTLNGTRAANDNVAVLEKEISLLGEAASVRAAAVAQLQAEQDLRTRGQSTGDAAGQAFIQSRVAAASAQVTLNEATANQNDLLSYQLDMLSQLDQSAQNAATGMAGAFGKVGGALGKLTTTLTGYAKKQEDIAKRQAEYTKRNGNDARRMEGFARESAEAQIQHYGDLLGASKSFFDEQSTAYKVLEGAEKAYRLFQFAMSVKSMLMKTAEATTTVATETTQTSAVVAGAGARASAKAAEGVAGIFAALGPFGFPVAAAAVAFMVAAGVGGLKGGSGSVGAKDAEERQTRQGSGSVLGDADAKSESLQNALDAVAKNTNADLEFSNGMLKSLQSIDSQIGSLTALLARQLSVGGTFDTSGLGLGSVSSGPGTLAKIMNPIAAVLPGLFGTKKTTTLQDQGLDLDSASLAAILSDGIGGNSYQQIATQTKKKAFGVTYSNKTKSSTNTAGLDEEMTDQITDVIGSLRTGVLAAAGELGITGAASVLDAMIINIGKISFKDMTGEEIEKALNDVFGKVADDMATTAAPFITELQKVGEGAFETLARVAREYQTLDVSLSSVGNTFGAVGVESLKARQRLIDLAGGIDALVEQTAQFADDFLSESERMTPVIKAVYAELGKLGYGAVTTKDKFKELVLGLDLTTEVGATAYAALMKIAPAFSKVTDYMTGIIENSQEVEDARQTLNDAYERELDVLTEVKEKWEGLVASLKKFRADLDSGPLAQLSPEDRYNKSKSLFETTRDKAMSGDTEAMENLQSVGEAYLNASKDYYASSEAYFADLASVKAATDAALTYAQAQVSAADAQLDALNRSVAGLLKIDESVLTVAQAISNLGSAMATQAAAQQAALQAAQQAAATAANQNTPAASTPTAANDNQAPNWSSYLKTNTDVAAAYQSESTRDKKSIANLAALGITSAEQFAEWHYNMAGKAEGRRPFAKGGAFVNGIVTEPTRFNIGEMGEDGPETIMPLTRTASGHMGVRAISSRSAGADGVSNAELLNLLRQLLFETRAANLQRGEMSKLSLQQQSDLEEAIETVGRQVRDAA